MLDTEAAAGNISSHAPMNDHSLVLGWMARRTCVFYAITASTYGIHSCLDCEIIRATRLGQELLLAARR